MFLDQIFTMSTVISISIFTFFTIMCSLSLTIRCSLSLLPQVHIPSAYFPSFASIILPSPATAHNAHLYYINCPQTSSKIIMFSFLFSSYIFFNFIHTNLFTATGTTSLFIFIFPFNRVSFTFTKCP